MAQVQVSLRDSYLGKDLKMTVSHAKSLGWSYAVRRLMLPVAEM
jgi:hypothetical protein